MAPDPELKRSEPTTDQKTITVLPPPEALDALKASVPERHRLILASRTFSTSPRTLDELGKELGVTRERIRQIEWKATQQIRDQLGGFAFHVPEGGNRCHQEADRCVGGAAIGLVGALVLPAIDRLSAAALTLSVAYGSFVVADTPLGVSGIMATLSAGLIIGGFAPSRASESVRQGLVNFWEALAYLANALLFLFIGLLIDPEGLMENLDAIGIAGAAVLLSGPLAIMPVVAGLERVGWIRRVGYRNALVLVSDGLRGGVALALALALPTDLVMRDRFVIMTGGVVLTTLLLNATTISTLVHRLGLKSRG